MTDPGHCTKENEIKKNPKGCQKKKFLKNCGTAGTKENQSGDLCLVVSIVIVTWKGKT